MTSIVLDVKYWGNSLGVRLPKAIAHAAHIHANQQVEMQVINQQVIITPLTPKALSLEQRLALFDPKKHGGEMMQSDEWLGAEQW